MIQKIKLAVALALGLALAVPAEAASDKDKPDDGGFMTQLTEAAEKISGDSGDTSGTKASVDRDKKSNSKADDAKTSLSELIKSSDSKTKTIDGNKVLVMPITGKIQERAQEVVLFGEQPASLKRYIDTLRRARLDDDVKTVVLRMGPNNIGMATAQELREAIEGLEKKNKKVIAIMEDDSQANYLVACAADEVVMPPSADLMLHGVSIDSYFLKDLLAKVGVKVQIIHIGQYKSYGEMYTKDDFTTPARKNMNEIVDGVYGQVKGMIAKSRHMSPEKAEEVINAGPVGAKKAQDLGLIDRIAYSDQVLGDLEKKKFEIVDSSDYKTSSKSGSSSEISLLSLLSMMSKSDDSDDSSGTNYPRVAILYAVGSITLGSNDDSGLGSSTGIASQDIIDELDKLKDDDKIKAVILRVNSPGGSAFASDLIWQKIEELKKKKPVVASMGDVAASGGYYISMGATRIVAQPGTITGSIGVVGGKPNLQGLYEKLGVHKTTIAKGRYAGLFSETSDFSPEQRQVIESMMKRTYDDFVTKAAQGRSRSYDQVHEVAQGRVWIGKKAKGVGLVDELGGLDTAIKETKSLIGLSSNDKIRLIAYPKEKSIVDVLQKAFGASNATVKKSSLSAAFGIDSMVSALPLPDGLKIALQQATAVSKMFKQESVLAVMPVMLDVR